MEKVRDEKTKHHFKENPDALARSPPPVTQAWPTGPHLPTLPHPGRSLRGLGQGPSTAGESMGVILAVLFGKV